MPFVVGAEASEAELRTFPQATFANWQLPDASLFVSELPHTSTGKLLKSELRRRYKGWKRMEVTSRPEVERERELELRSAQPPLPKLALILSHNGRSRL